MPRLRFPTPEQFERYVPYPFLATWIACGIVVFVALLAERGPARGQDGAVPLVPYAVVAVVSGYLAAGVVVGLLSLAHGSAWRLIGNRVRGGEQGTGYTPAPLRRAIWPRAGCACSTWGCCWLPRPRCGWIAAWPNGAWPADVPDSCTSHWTSAWSLDMG